MSKLAAGSPAPDFELPDLEGRLWRLSSLRGSVVLLNFWSAECPWVERVDRELSALQTDGWVLLPIAPNKGETLEQMRQSAHERGLPQVLVDSGLQVADLYGAETTPHFFLVDRGGILRYQGAYDNVTFRSRTPTRSYVREALRALERGRPVEIEETPPFGCSIIRFSED